MEGQKSESNVISTVLSHMGQATGSRDGTLVQIFSYGHVDVNRYHLLRRETEMLRVGQGATRVTKRVPQEPSRYDFNRNSTYLPSPHQTLLITT